MSIPALLYRYVSATAAVRRAALAASLALAGVLGCPQPVAAPADPVTISDAALRTALESALGKSTGQTITEAEMATLTSLTASNKMIASLAGLQFATGLTSLRLERNQISDVSPLSGLTALTLLSLQDNQISDISDLSGLTALTTLWLRNNRISDVSALSDLTALRSLILSSNQISDVSALSGLTALTGLSLNSNQISDVSALSDMTALTSLNLSSNQISNVSPLSGLTSLTGLSLPSNRISDVSDLSGLTALTLLSLSANQISDVSALSDMTALTTLFLSNNRISDISHLSGLTALTWLNLHNNQISSVSGLSGLTALTRLRLNRNQVSSVSPLSGLTALTYLDLESNQISDVSDLSGLTALTTLWLGNNRISDISHLSSLMALRTLVLQNNRISDLSGLSGLTALTVLALSSNRISDISDLSGLTALTFLTLQNNQISDLSALSGLTALRTLTLQNNQISDISPLVANAGLATGDDLRLRGNPLDATARTTHIPALRARGVTVQSPFDPVTIPDASLRAVLEGALGKDAGESIIVAEMATLTSLTANGRGIASLAGLEFATGLTSLSLRGNQVSDLSPLSGLTALTNLDLSNNQVSDIAPLAENAGLGNGDNLDLRSNPLDEAARATHIPALRARGVTVRFDPLVPPEPPPPPPEDDFSGQGVDDLSTVDLYRGLTELNLGDNRISDISALARLTRLTTLNLGGNRISDISALAALTALATLDLGGNRISDISVLAALTALTALDLNGNRISDIPALAALTALTTLDLGGNRISDISVLAALIALTTLDLNGNRISDISVLAALTALTTLDLGGNRISDISALAALTGLTTLNLGGNGISDISATGNPSGAIASKRHLNDNGISDISPLEGLTMLTTLDLGGNRVSDVSPLAGLAMLTTLDLGGNRISDISALEGLTALTRLDLGDNNLADISTLAELTSLTWLNLAGNGISDISALVANAGLGEGDEVDLRGNPLDAAALETHVPALTARGVTVRFDAPWDADRLAACGDGNAAGLEPSESILPMERTIHLVQAAGDPVRRSFVRLVNPGGAGANVELYGIDDAGAFSRAGPVALRLPPEGAMRIDAEDLERGNEGKGLTGRFCDGDGDWQLMVRSDRPLTIMSLAGTPDGFVSGLDDLVPVRDFNEVYFADPGDNDGRQTHLRVVNRSARGGLVFIAGVDDAGTWSPDRVSFRLGPWAAREVSVRDLELGGREKGLTGGLGDGAGGWSLIVRSSLDLRVSSLMRAADGRLANLSGLVEGSPGGEHRVPLAVAASDPARESLLRVVNRGGDLDTVTISAVDDAGGVAPGGDLMLTLGPFQAVELTGADLEMGNLDKGAHGALGRGAGHWRLTVSSPLSLAVTSLVRTPDGFVTNVSGVAPAADGVRRVPMFNPGGDIGDDGDVGQGGLLRIANETGRDGTATIRALDDAGEEAPGGAVTLALPAGRAVLLSARELEEGGVEGLSGGLGDGSGNWRLAVDADVEVLVQSLLETPDGSLTNLSRPLGDNL